MSTKLFIIHGWSYNLDKWQKISPLLEAKGFKPIMLRVPGLTAPSDQVWDIDGYVAWLDEQLAGEKEPIVIGHSNGGRIAMAYAQKHPGRLKQLILIDSAGLTHREFVRRLKLKVLYILSKMGKLFGAIQPLRRLFYKVIGARDYYQAPANMRTTMQNMLAADNLIDPAGLSLPTTLIWGRGDTITPLKDGQRLHGLIAGSELHIVDEARHAPQDTQPEQVAELIEKAVRV